MRLMTNRWATLLMLGLVACVVALAPNDTFACSAGSHAAGGYDHGTGASQIAGGHDHSAGASEQTAPGHYHDADASNATYYTCPMPEHSDVRSNQPGTCPRCGMKLVAKSGSDIAPSPEAKPIGEAQHQHAH